jgi:hypothetical protein
VPKPKPFQRARRNLGREPLDDEVTGDWMIRAPKGGLTSPGRPREETELEKWWRVQAQDLERAAKERVDVKGSAKTLLLSQARVFGALGVPVDVAAALMGINEVLFGLHYQEAYAVGESAMLAKVAANYLRIATSGQDRYAVKAAGEILARRGGEPWKPPAQKIEVEKVAPKQRLIDSTKLTPEERQALRAIIVAAQAREQLAKLEHDEEQAAGSE